MFDLILFLEGILSGLAFVGLFVLSFVLGRASISFKNENIKKNIFGQVKKAQIIKREDEIDILLKDETK